MKLILITCCLYCLLGLARAQQPSPTPPPLPPGPLMQERAPERSRWIIKTYIPDPSKQQGEGQAAVEGGGTQGALNSAKQNPLKLSTTVVMTKDGKNMLCETFDGGRLISSTWCADGLQTTISPDGKNPIVQAKQGNDPDVPTPNYVDYSHSDFFGFEWVKLSDYSALVEINGKKCILYKQSQGNGNQAYVDLKTRLPVLLIEGGNTQAYEFQPASAKLTPPPQINQLMSNLHKMSDSGVRRVPN